MNTNNKKIIGPFTQILTLQNLPMKGCLQDSELETVENAGIIVENGKISEIDTFDTLKKNNLEVEYIEENAVMMPAFVDAHTHICFGGSRHEDYAMRIAGLPYLEIAKAGGGILSSVRNTRGASLETLTQNTIERANRQFLEGVLTCEVKSGYGLSLESELKMLRAIQEANKKIEIDLIATCLSAHTRPPEFDNNMVYLNHILNEILPQVKAKNLSNRVDIFVEETAFTVEEGRYFLQKAKAMGFQITIHADQFSAGGSALAVELGALSADHLEASGNKEIELLAKADIVAMVLPGASLGLGMDYSPARRLLDAGACLAISTDWNPGSAPMGDLLLQASILSAKEKLSTAETFAGITFRAAKALNLYDRGVLQKDKKADMIAFPCQDFREVLYQQGKMKPYKIWKNGVEINEQ